MLLLRRRRQRRRQQQLLSAASTAAAVLFSSSKPRLPPSNTDGNNCSTIDALQAAAAPDPPRNLHAACMSSESLFCRDCGALLDVSRSASSKISCARCPYSVPLNQYCSSYTRVSSSRAKIDYNSLYRLKP